MNSSSDCIAGEPPAGTGLRTQLAQTFRNPLVAGAALILLALALLAMLAPWIATHDPSDLNPSERLQGMSSAHWMGTDAFGRDVYSRVVHGARTSLIIGLSVAIASLAFGLVIGMVAGYFRWADMIIMRIMDGMMAIPGILLAIALVSLSGASLTTVLVAIAIPEIPRVVRMVRGVILSVRTEPYVEAATVLGTRVPLIMWRHMLPNTIAPLIVQGTYIFASAMLTESILSFLGAGIPPEVPSWGNVMAEGRMYFIMKPYLILLPGAFLSLAVLSVNILGDSLRDALDPRMTRRI